MNAEQIRTKFNDLLVTEDDREAALRVEECALHAERNSLLAELVKVQTAQLEVARENLEIMRKGQAFALDPDAQGKHAFLTQLGLQKAVNDYNKEHPFQQLGIAVPQGSGRGRG